MEGSDRGIVWRFCGVFFPAAWIDIDWSRSYESFDKELQQILRNADSGRRVVDHLAKVWLKNGQEEWLLIHVEVQAQAAPEFLKRLYSCNTRIFDRYQRDVVTFVILADENAKWRPAIYQFERWDFRLQMEFQTAKLVDIVKSRDDLETHRNPFAVLTLAHIRTQETKHDPEERRIWKFRLVRSLYQRGLSPEKVRCIDWMLSLPSVLEDAFWDDVIQLKKENPMPYIDIATRKGMEKGTRNGILESILMDWEIKFGEIDAHANREVEAINDVDLLRRVLRAGKAAASIEDVRKVWKASE